MADSSRVPSHRLPHFFGGIPPLRAGLRDSLAQLDSIAIDGLPESPIHTSTCMQKFKSIFKMLGRCLEPDGGNVGGIVSMRNMDQQAAIASTPLLKAAKDANMAAFQCALQEICTRRGESEELAVVETRGAEGETAAHLCMLFHTKRHVDMATRLFKRYGKPLINAAYRGESYKGETALHMAIEKRNVELVRMLCDMGADLHARATGIFFKKRKVGGDDTYFGEFPLSFAIATGQHEVAAILLEKGANPYAQDTYGNTALHIAVLKKQPAMYSFLRAWVEGSGAEMGCETGKGPPRTNKLQMPPGLYKANDPVVNRFVASFGFSMWEVRPWF